MKVAFVTGGTKGIGLGIVQALLDHGCYVAYTGTSQASIDATLSEIATDKKANVLPLVCDVRQLDSQQSCIEKIIEKWGRIDYVIANAGVGHFEDITTMPVEKWQEIIDVNVHGVFYTLRAATAALMESKGYYITISSLAGTNFFATAAAYNASKYAVTGFTQAAMLDLRKHDIKATTIMPGSVATHFNGNEPSEKDDWKIQPEDIGKLVVDLVTMPARTLPSKIEVRPSFPHKK